MSNIPKFDQVRPTLGSHMLTDGMHMVWDIDQSEGSWIADGLSGRKLLDLFSFFATNPVGHNHRKIVSGPAAEEIARIAVHNPSNSDIYTREMADFVQIFWETTIPDGFKYTFFVAGGALAVENALKAAFDWKVQKNAAKGIRGEKGTKILHFREAFHGRSGYTMSLTNTLPDKIRRFPKFNWPRVSNPKAIFPLESHMGEIVAAERKSIEEIKQAFVDYPDEIAAVIIEPIQGEGGDNHFRPEFLQQLRTLADENEALLIFDEVQTGLGLTGQWWAFESLGVTPDIFSFGKKMQVCGIVAGPKLDEVEKNVFHTPSRINSTWGGNLIDMTRAKHYIRVIEEENLLANTREQGAFLLSELQKMVADYPHLLSNARGRGLMCAVTVRDGETRDLITQKLYERDVMILGAGFTSIRVRPSLNITRSDIEFGVEKMREVLADIR
ncbi:L-lysine 6-transaminase [bacterium]|nr:L-lysine 6-transaminase [bacterium]